MLIFNYFTYYYNYEDPDLNYQTSYNNTITKISKIKTSIITPNMSNTGTIAQLEVIMLDQFSDIIYDGNIKFKINNETIDANIKNGIAKVKQYNIHMLWMEQ